MPRKPKHENQPTQPTLPAPVPNILDAFKSPAPPSPRATEPVTAAPYLSDEPGERVQKVLSDAAAAMHDPEPAPTTPPLPRAVEILFDLALEVSEKEKTSISTRLDAASELVAWLLATASDIGVVSPVPRIGALRIFLEHIAEYRVRCEPKERVRAAALLLKLG